VIAISFSGESAEVIECVKNAKDNKSKTICFNAFMKSKLTDYADVLLLTVPVKYRYQKIDISSGEPVTCRPMPNSTMEKKSFWETLFVFNVKIM
jgi:DNA-binding MurR/RpiR family transcriptional regulator